MSSVRWMMAAASSALVFAGSALAHVGLPDGATGAAGTNQVLTFGVGHGCEGADTVAIEIMIPENVTAVRALMGPAPFGEPTLTVSDAELVTSVKWSKDTARAADDSYYQFAIRVGVPEAPFSTIYFPVRQTCETSAGDELVIDWALTEADIEAGEEGEPASGLKIIPAYVPGWNKITVEDGLEDLSYFDNAQIVWSGDAAYSSNPVTKSQIAAEDDVDELTEIEAGAEIWVKY